MTRSVHAHSRQGSLFESTEAAVASAAATIQACAETEVTGPWRRIDRAVFVDRDGTIIADKPYSVDPEQVEILSGAADGLHMLQEHGYRLIVVTNQSGIARGFFSETDLRRMHDRLGRILGDRGISVTAFYFCPHHVDGTIPSLARPCPFRKPGAKMVQRAARDWSIDLTRSWLVGDRPTDVAAALAAGCRPVLLEPGPDSGDVIRAADLVEAATRIIASDACARSGAAGGRRVIRPG